jgi:hypothetical protein
LDLLGLAVWWMDDGTCCTSQYIKKDRKPSYYKHFQLRTDCFTLNEYELLCSWFKGRFNINPEIKSQRGNYYLAFSKAQQEMLIQLIDPYIIPALKYKLGYQKLRRIC